MQGSGIDGEFTPSHTPSNLVGEYQPLLTHYFLISEVKNRKVGMENVLKRVQNEQKDYFKMCVPAKRRQRRIGEHTKGQYKNL